MKQLPADQPFPPGGTAWRTLLRRLDEAMPFRPVFSLGGLFGSLALAAWLAGPHVKPAAGLGSRPTPTQMGYHWTTGEIRMQCREAGAPGLRLSAMSDDKVQIVITTVSLPANLPSQQRLRIVDAAGPVPDPAHNRTDRLVGTATLCEKASGSCHLMEGGEALLGPADSAGSRTIRFNVRDRASRAQGTALLTASTEHPLVCSTPATSS